MQPRKKHRTSDGGGHDECKKKDLADHMLCWNMISIQVGTKYIDLIVPNNKEMDILIHLLLQFGFYKN